MQVNTESMLGCDDELLTADFELPMNDVLQTFGLFVKVETDSLKTNLRQLSRIIDSKRFIEKCQGVLTDYFTKT